MADDEFALPDLDDDLDDLDSDTPVKAAVAVTAPVAVKVSDASKDATPVTPAKPAATEVTATSSGVKSDEKTVDASPKLAPLAMKAPATLSKGGLAPLAPLTPLGKPGAKSSLAPLAPLAPLKSPPPAVKPPSTVVAPTSISAPVTTAPATVPAPKLASASSTASSTSAATTKVDAKSVVEKDPFDESEPTSPVSRSPSPAPTVKAAAPVTALAPVKAEPVKPAASSSAVAEPAPAISAASVSSTSTSPAVAPSKPAAVTPTVLTAAPIAAASNTTDKTSSEPGAAPPAVTPPKATVTAVIDEKPVAGKAPPPKPAAPKAAGSNAPSRSSSAASLKPVAEDKKADTVAASANSADATNDAAFAPASVTLGTGSFKGAKRRPLSALIKNEEAAELKLASAAVAQASAASSEPTAAATPSPSPSPAASSSNLQPSPSSSPPPPAAAASSTFAAAFASAVANSADSIDEQKQPVRTGSRPSSASKHGQPQRRPSTSTQHAPQEHKQRDDSPPSRRRSSVNRLDPLQQSHSTPQRGSVNSKQQERRRSGTANTHAHGSAAASAAALPHDQHAHGHFAAHTPSHSAQPSPALTPLSRNPSHASRPGLNVAARQVAVTVRHRTAAAHEHMPPTVAPHHDNWEEELENELGGDEIHAHVRGGKHQHAIQKGYDGRHGYIAADASPPAVAAGAGNGTPRGGLPSIDSARHPSHIQQQHRLPSQHSHSHAHLAVNTSGHYGYQNGLPSPSPSPPSASLQSPSSDSSFSPGNRTGALTPMYSPSSTSSVSAASHSHSAAAAAAVPLRLHAPSRLNDSPPFIEPQAGESCLRVFTGTWNLHAKPFPNNLSDFIPPNEFDLYVIGTEECENSIETSFILTSKAKWTAALSHLLGSEYKEIAQQTLQAIHIIAFVRISLFPHVHHIEHGCIPTGLGDIVGNKGGVGIGFDISNTSFLFINAHLAAHQNSSLQRNNDFHKISLKLPFKEKLLLAHPSLLRVTDRFDRVFFMGDLNYRINSNRKMVDALINKGMIEVLLANDQLNIIREKKEAFYGFIEGEINFLPTYKFDNNKDIYDSSKKKRIPSYTDRILWKPNSSISLIEYKSINSIKTSDHRPVVANFLIKIKQRNIDDQHKLKKAVRGTIAGSRACAIQ